MRAGLSGALVGLGILLGMIGVIVLLVAASRSYEFNPWAFGGVLSVAGVALIWTGFRLYKPFD